MALRDLKRPQEAAASYARLLAVDPGYPYAQGFHLHARLQACDWTGYAHALKAVEAGVLEGRRVDVPFSFFSVSDSPAAQLRCARTWVVHKCPEVPDPVWKGERYLHDRIRIAYLSADFAEHPVGYAIARLLELHDRARFEVIGVSFGPDITSPMRERLKRAFERYIDVRNMSDREVAQTLRRMEVDIAIDLNGFTQGHRAGIFAHRIAPVQVSYLGHSGTTGAKYLDYVIADEHVIPAEHESCFTEKVVRLPGTFFCTDRSRPIAGSPPSRAMAGLPATGFVFCCFNNSFKIVPPIFDIWMRLLGRVKGSVLWLFEDNNAAAGNLRREAEIRGIDPNRLVFAKRLPKIEDHLSRYRLADLFLDTLPYNAHATAGDALWAGTPVLTCMGSAFAGRVAASLLYAAGVPELVTRDLAAYEDVAYRLASDQGLVDGLKARLAENRLTCPLFDTESFRKNIEQAYLDIHERHTSDASR
jgi:predicted O-linked N-acetylglucosamine transferase (SPINDLY family)